MMSLTNLGRVLFLARPFRGLAGPLTPTEGAGSAASASWPVSRCDPFELRAFLNEEEHNRKTDEVNPKGRGLTLTRVSIPLAPSGERVGVRGRASLRKGICIS
jgi:hypothetical protein